MNEILEKFWKDTKKRVTQKPYFWITIIGLCGLIIIPIIIWLFFLVGDNGFVLINTSLEVGDALGFYASVFASVATLVLGVIAVMQNNRLQKLETDVVKRSNSCSINITHHDSRTTQKLPNENQNPYKTSNSYFTAIIENHSEPFLKKFTIQFENEVFCNNLTLVKGASKAVKIFLPLDFDARTMPTCKVAFTSCYDVETHGDFQLVIEDDAYVPKIRYYHFYGTNKAHE